MIWGIHYLITKIKTKIYIIPRSCFKCKQYSINQTTHISDSLPEFIYLTNWNTNSNICSGLQYCMKSNKVFNAVCQNKISARFF